MSHQAEIADTYEPRRQHVQQVPSQELVGRERHQTLLVVVSGIAPAKSDHAIGQGDESACAVSRARSDSKIKTSEPGLPGEHW